MGAHGRSAPTLNSTTVRPSRAAVRTDIPWYVRRSDPAFAWTTVGRRVSAAGTIHILRMTSQVWRGHTWEHDLRVYQPEGLAARDAMLLVLAGGSNPRESEPEDVAMGFALARYCGARCAVLRQVPNQPLFDGMMEDALIAESFVQYLRTGDEDWPLLFPMVKSALRAMDVLQAWSGTEDGATVARFVLAGASKRGWTAWLTAACDARVAALVPMVIDTLNVPAQNARQLEVWGRNSEMIEDYRRRGLLARDEATGAPGLWRLVDPYSYRDRLAQPKLLVNGTNDRYWTLEALNLYWDDLKGPKHVVYVPNAGHGPAAHHDHARRGIGALFRHALRGRTLPSLRWEHSETEDGRLRLTVAAQPAPSAARLWVAQSEGRDFRDACWEPAPMPVEGTSRVGEVPRPPQGHIALFGELDYEIDGLTYHLSTQIRQVGPRPGSHQGEPCR